MALREPAAVGCGRDKTLLAASGARRAGEEDDRAGVMFPKLSGLGSTSVVLQKSHYVTMHGTVLTAVTSMIIPV